jgi:hypothetical protein
LRTKLPHNWRNSLPRHYHATILTPRHPHQSPAFSHRNASCKLCERPLTVRTKRKRRELIRPPAMVSSSEEASRLLKTCWAVSVRRKSTEE